MCFYADNGLIENVDPEKLQLDLNKLVDLFERVGLETNEIKMKLMVARGKQAPSARTRETYNRLRRDAKANKKRENWSKQKGRCPECGKEILNVSMKRHRKTMHQVTGEEYLCRPVGTTGTFEITAPRRGEHKQCPVQGCEGGGMDRFSIFQHFAWVHNEATLTVRGGETLPKCNLCGMQVKNVDRHQKTKTCERLQRRRENEGL